MATVNALALKLIAEFGESTADTDLVAVVEPRINEALQEIGLAANFNPFKARATFATGIGTAQYNMPASAREINQLRFVTDSQPITMSTMQDLAMRGVQLTDSGRPVFWLEDGVAQSGANNLLRIRLVPVPAAVENIEEEHYFDPTDTASASHLQVPDSWLICVLDRTRSWFLENEGKYDASALAIRRYEKNLKFLVGRENNKIARKITLQPVDLAGVRTRRGPRLPNNFPDV